MPLPSTMLVRGAARRRDDTAPLPDHNPCNACRYPRNCRLHGLCVRGLAGLDTKRKPLPQTGTAVVNVVDKPPAGWGRGTETLDPVDDFQKPGKPGRPRKENR